MDIEFLYSLKTIEPDEALRLALSALGVEVSRRAVAKYRMAMDIPSSSQRKKR